METGYFDKTLDAFTSMARIRPDQCSQLPRKPGVYHMKDANDALLYVGKAKDLRARVSSYFRDAADHSPRIRAMVQQVVAIDYTMTRTEIDALILESNMIKTLRPRYNILMRDDKKYPWLVLTNEPYPRLVFTREPFSRSRNGVVDWAKCFGPYPSASALYHTLQVIKKLFPLRQRKKPLFKDRPCMNYHIGACLGPCQKLVTPQEYQVMIDQVVMFLKGNGDVLLGRLEADMQAASDALAFEKAALLRDRIEAVHKILVQQRVVYEDPSVSQDVIGSFEQAGCLYFAVFKVRRGRLIHTAFYDVPMTGNATPQEAYETFVFQYYQTRADLTDLPRAILLQYALDDEALLLDWLKHSSGYKTTLSSPKKGFKQDILQLAIQNAEESANHQHLEQQARHQHDPALALLFLQDALSLPQAPIRMECYDISHIQGTNTVASMVVFTGGLPDKNEYRRFKIQSTEEGKPDDFKSMAEVMTRRFRNRDASEKARWPDPDLIIIDGGKGQLSAAVEALKAIGVEDLPIISLAKKFEEVFLPGQSRPVVLPRDSTALFLLQNIRDEAHRFAITFHRSLRAKAQTKSYLDSIKGVGPKRKEKLQATYPTQVAFLAAHPQDIAACIGSSLNIAGELQRQVRLNQIAD